MGPKSDNIISPKEVNNFLADAANKDFYYTHMILQL